MCLQCLGAYSGIKDPEIEDEERGRIVWSENADKLKGSVEQASPENCQICRGLFLNLHGMADAAASDLEGYEFSSMLVGSKQDEDSRMSETYLGEILGSEFDSVKKRFNRKFGKILEMKLNKAVNFQDPDIIITVDLQYLSFSYTIKSLYIGGTYLKKSRNLPQTRWIHTPLNDTNATVESIIGQALCDMAGGENYFLHGAGREDVDVMMLGNGREFILEVSNPRKRSIDLAHAAKLINLNNYGVEVSGLVFRSRDDVPLIKKAEHDKSYRARVKSASVVNAAALESAVKAISGKDIYQRTPLRVSTRRSDTVRVKKVRDVKLEWVSDDTFEITVRAQSGTYIKELITGDGGRTVPSLSSEYGSPLEVLSLDVIWIHRDGE
ncbi:MAG: tRNA pseudouridine(54/55) synthase Pus10 [Thermoplasmataceae archaeon]